MFSKSKFSAEELGQLRRRTEEVAELFEEGHGDRCLFLQRDRGHHCITFSFDCEDTPEVEGVDRYLAENYECIPSGMVRVNSTEEAYGFLIRVEERAKDPHPINYQNILKAASHLVYGAIAGEIGKFTDDYSIDLPAEADGIPYWLEDTGLEDAEVITVVNDLPGYGNFCGVTAPKDNVASLMVLAYHDRGEAEEELAYYLENAKIPEGSLEELLFEQLFCTHYNCAYIQYALAATLWLLPVPENLEYLEIVLDGENFKDFYDDVPERRYVQGREDEDGRYYPGKFVADEISPREEAVTAWLDAVRDEIEQITYQDDHDEYLEEWLRLNEVLPTLTV